MSEAEYARSRPYLERDPTWRVTRWDFGFATDYLWPPVFYEHSGSTGAITLRIPLWTLFVASLLPTLLLWFLDRRRRPGHCRCGYNLTGLTSGCCPECGSATPAPPVA